MSQAGSLSRHEALVKRHKNQLCDHMTTEPARLAGIPVMPGSPGESVHLFYQTGDVDYPACYGYQ